MMKNKILLVLVAAAVSLPLWGGSKKAQIPDKPDWNGHYLTQLWSKYYKASANDRQKTRITLLEAIREQARSDSRMKQDYYDATTALLRATGQTNWRALSEDRILEIQDDLLHTCGAAYLYDFGKNTMSLPVEERLDLLEQYRDQLLSDRHPGLWSSTPLPEEFIVSDYEAFLWDLANWDLAVKIEPRILTKLKECIQDRYPADAVYAWWYTLPNERNSHARLQAMDSLAKRYAGTPFVLVAREGMLLTERERLGETGTEEAYLSLRDRAKALQKERKAQEKELSRIGFRWTQLDRLVSGLEEEKTSIRFWQDSLMVILRNRSRATISRTDGWTAEAVAKHRRFYIQDTVMLYMPETLNDGDYQIRPTWTHYGQYTLSLAVRRANGRHTVFASDHRTGEPAGQIGIELKIGGRTRRSELSTPAFTPLPEQLEKALSRRGRKNAYIRATLREASGACRYSPWVALGQDHGQLKDKAEKKTKGPDAFASIFRDKGAYLPKDSVHFKVVLYSGDPQLKLETCPAGRKATLSVTGPDGKTLTDIALVTNEFGSAAGVFSVPEDARPGSYLLTLKQENKKIAASSFRIEDYTLHNFKIILDEDRTIHLSGDRLRISGRVLAYSGHPVSGARVQGWLSSIEGKQEVTTGDDGSFAFNFLPDRTGTTEFTCKVSDATGETLDLTEPLTIRYSAAVAPILRLLNPQTGTVAMPHRSVFSEESCALMDGPVADIRISAEDRPGHEVDQTVIYFLTDKEGKLLLEGKATTRDTLHLDLSSLPDGFYEFTAGPDGREKLSLHNNLMLAKFDTESSPKGIAECLFLPADTNLQPGEDICFRLGATDGPLWVTATLSDPSGDVLDSRVLHLSGIPGDANALQEIRIPYDISYPDALRLQFLYFRNGEKRQWNQIYTRQRKDLDLPLQWTRFEDRTRPAASYTFTASVPEGVEGVAAIADRALDRLQPNEWQTVRLKTPTVRPTATTAASGSITGFAYYKEKTGGWAEIRGRIVDEFGDPVIGAAVLVAGQPSRAVLSDIDGSFCIEARIGEMLEFISIGYVTEIRPARPGMKVVLRAEEEMLSEAVVVAYGVSRKASLTGSVHGVRARGVQIAHEYEPDDSAWEEEDDQPAAGGVDGPAPELDFAFRDSFADVLAFEPFLRDAQGALSFSFRTSDRLSTYRTALFVHNRQMQNGLLQRDFTVTIPVKVAVNEPRRLYAGDDYILSASAYSTAEEAVSGTLWVLGYDGVDDGQKEPLFRKQQALSVPANASAGARFSIRVPAGVDTLGLKILFDGDGFRDGVAVKVPVSDQLQTRTESHSALLRPGQRADSLARALERRFVNVKDGEITQTEISLDELIRKAASRERVPDGDDALALSKAYCAQRLSGHDDEALLERVLACRNEDGGFGWTPGMKSSPAVTAALLDHFALLREQGIGGPDLTSSVKYLDLDLVTGRPWWAGGITQESYMLVRSRYAEIPFSYEVEREDRREARSRFADFRRFARRYLSPSMRYDILDGRVLAKAERLQTLRNLTATQAGLNLAMAWGEHFGVDDRLRNAMHEDLASLVEYAVAHPSGGIYYPNAVMPFRGVLESEAYAHALLCELLADAGKEFPQAPEIAEGIRLWLMIQHETQDWSNDPGFLRALRAAGRASEKTRGTRLMVLSRTGTKPFTEIKADGNGYTLTRRLFREDGSPVTPGDVLHIGETVHAVYAIQSKENRSFLLLTLPREACFSPTDPLSGPCAVRFTPAVQKGWYALAPDAYRSVKPDRDEVYFDVFPEGEVLLEETWYVTQAGAYVAPPAELRCDYAPHYQATDAFAGKFHAVPFEGQE